MGRQPCCDKEGMKKGPWSAEEDSKLSSFITHNGHSCWRQVPKLAGLLRCGKSCRLRWKNYLRPDLKRGPFSEEEDQQIIHLHAAIGNKWSRIAAQLPGRTDNEIKNYWNTCIRKKICLMGIDPSTHKPFNQLPSSSLPPCLHANPTTLSDIASLHHQQEHDQDEDSAEEWMMKAMILIMSAKTNAEIAMHSTATSSDRCSSSSSVTTCSAVKPVLMMRALSGSYNSTDEETIDEYSRTVSSSGAAN